MLFAMNIIALRSIFRLCNPVRRECCRTGWDPRKEFDAALESLQVDELPRPHVGKWAQFRDEFLSMFRHGRIDIDPVRPWGFFLYIDVDADDSHP